MTLAETIRGLGRPKILVIGDLVLDHYVFGAVTRISPEAPIGVLRVTDEESRLGAAGSVARNLAVLGADVQLVGFLGADPHADEFLRLCAESGIRTAGVVRTPGRETLRKTRFLGRRGAGGQQVLRVDRGETGPYAAAAATALAKAAADATAGVDLVVLSDYRKGVLETPLVRQVIEAGRARGIPVLVDPKPPDFARYRGATALTPNRPETESHVGFPIDDLAAAGRAAAALREDLDLEAAVVTLDQDGIWFAGPDGATGHFPTAKREVFDVTGAGDMVISALAMAIAAGAAWADAVRIANLAAGIEVSRLGVVPVSREEILEALHEEAASPDSGKLRPLPDLLEILAARRVRGERVVFTNGCFDLLHPGHLELLKRARAEGDALVVGLNSDASIRRLKGADRPVLPEPARAAVLSALSFVDHVVLFDDDTPQALIAAIRPDVLVKGADWKDRVVVGREEVEKAGGRVVLVPLVAGFSSTALIRKIREEEE